MTNERKAPSWLARRMQTGRSQRQETAGVGLDCRLQNVNCGGGGPTESAADTFRPTHKRNKSLAAMDDFLIYNKELERASEAATATRCDKTSASTIKKLMNNKPNEEESGERRRHEQENNGGQKKDAQFRCDHERHYLFGGDVNGGRKINDFIKQRLTSTTTADNKTSKLPLRLRLKWLLAKPLSSLSVISCLLLMTMTMLSAGFESRGSLVINVSEQQARHSESISSRAAHAHPAIDHHAHLPHDKHKHEQHKHQVRFIIVNNASSQRVKRASGHDNDQAADQKLERSAKLQEEDALNYLHRYGYMSSSGGASTSGSNAINLISEDSFQKAVMQFQRFAGIPETGSVDSLTVRYMQMPRCGNKDMSGKGENGKRRRRKRRRKRYALQGSKWRRQELSYRISQYPTRFKSKKHEVDLQIERAFKIWSQVAPIDFVVKKDGRVHIDIRFASGEHGDGDPFDGPGNTLAHAYFPQYGGDAHFDDQEYWTVDSYAGTNIFQVAAHELGHSLGLGHSSVREALMAPFYQKFKPNFKLHADDVLAIQALYGERGGGNGAGSNDDEDSPSSTSTTSTSTESAPPRRRPPVDGGDSDGGFIGGSSSKPVDLCQDPKVDAITRTEDGNTYVFRGHYYWQIKNEGLASGSPGKISRDWDGLPANLDAALTWSDGKTFFFKGNKYWRYFNKRREPGYPKLISVGFAGIPDDIQAAFVWGGNGKTYFFKGSEYWRFDSKQEPPVSGQYPKAVKTWSGLPTSNIDAAFKWENGMTYFFKDDLYYRFDDREFEVDSSARPAFPRSTAEWWFGCTNSNLPIRRAPSSESLQQSSRASNDIETSQSQSEPSLLLFHRRPNLSYEPTSDSAPRNRHSSSGGSLSRSIFTSLSSLFPSPFSSSSSSPSSSPNDHSNSSANLEDWSFHRGLGEEVSRQLKAARAAPEPSASGEGRSASRWFFPLGSSQSGNTNNNNNSKEQSLSELRMMTNDSCDVRRAVTDDNNN